MVALLSHSKIVGDMGGKPMPDNNVRSQMASLEASKAAVYSASHEDVATVR